MVKADMAAIDLASFQHTCVLVQASTCVVYPWL